MRDACVCQQANFSQTSYASARAGTHRNNLFSDTIYHALHIPASLIDGL